MTAVVRVCKEEINKLGCPGLTLSNSTRIQEETLDLSLTFEGVEDAHNFLAMT